MNFLLNALCWLIWLINIYLIAAGIFLVGSTISYIAQQINEHKQNKVINVNFESKKENLK